MNKIYIYYIRNKINNLYYIGQTVDFERRKYEDLTRYNDGTEKSENSYLYRAFTDEELLKTRYEYNFETAKSLYNKYGVEKISFRGFEAILRSQNYKHLPHYKQLKEVSYYE